METAETRARLAEGIRQLQAKGDTQGVTSLVDAYKRKYKSETRESRIEQGLPVGQGERVEPTFGGNIVRGIVKPLAKVATSVKNIGETLQGKTATDTKSKYLGNIEPVGKGFDITSFSPKSVRGAIGAAGTGLELSSYLPVGAGVRAAGEVIRQPFKQAIGQSAKVIGREGAIQGGLGEAGRSFQEGDKIGKTLAKTAGGTALGGILGAGLGVGTGAISRAFTRTPVDVISQNVDKNIRKIFEGTTADVGKIDEMSFKARQGLELLNKEAPTIEIPDTKAPLGSGSTKAFNIQKASPNEILYAVLELDKKIVNNARQAAENATKQGFNIDTKEAREIIQRAIKNGEVASSTGSRVLKQLDATGETPVGIFDWVQDVNKRYKKKYERGTIQDTMIGKLADDVAENLRKQLNSITDRTGYADAFGNNQELKRMIVSIAKKVNKKVNFGDISSDAGLDAAISVLTGNPAYMARTLGSTVFKGILNKLRSYDGLKALKRATKGIKKIPTKTNLPSKELKQKRLLLPSGNINKPQSQVNVPIRLPEKSQSAIDADEVSRIQSQLSSNNTTMTNLDNNIPRATAKTVPINPISNSIQQDTKKVNILQKIKDIPNKQGGFIKAYKGNSDLTTKILKDLEGKTTVSKQYILDATNRGDLKQMERDITRQILDTMPDGQINVKEFANKVKAELLPLKVKSSDAVNPKFDQYSSRYMQNEGSFSTKYDNIALPDELRGKIANYKENIYESPISTSAGDVHFGYTTKNYFGHTRIEDMADNKTRRVIEVQSDLYQKGRLENEMTTGMAPSTDAELAQALPENLRKEFKQIISDRKAGIKKDGQVQRLSELNNIATKLRGEAQKGKLQQYNDPTAHFRMIREEIKKAAQDGKTKLQFPTGETAMKIEGLGTNENWVRPLEKGGFERVKPDELKVGQQISQGRDPLNDNWIITDVLGNGKFKAVPKQVSTSAVGMEAEGAKGVSGMVDFDKFSKEQQNKIANALSETFDISGKVDTNNPIYKFYEKDVQKYLNKFGGKRVVDDKGVSWIEIPITKEQGESPVEAFGKIQVNPLFAGAGISALGVGAIAIREKAKKQSKLPKKPSVLMRQKESNLSKINKK